MPILTTIGAASARNYGLFGKTGLVVDYTVVAGGNSGGQFLDGNSSTIGGAAGQLRYVSGASVNIGAYSVVVGGGGAKNVSKYGVAGSASSFNGTTAAVGTAGNDVQTSGAGYVRGNPAYDPFYETGGSGGGGGNSSNGGNASALSNEAYGGNGGSGSSDVILGTTRAGGGGGAASVPGTNFGGSGGSGTAGGGAGGITKGGSNSAGSDASANYGSGGGAAGGQAAGGNGGSGIVIIRYSDIGGQRASGGTVTQSGGYYIHTFTGSGTFTVNY